MAKKKLEKYGIQVKSSTHKGKSGEDNFDLRSQGLRDISHTGDEAFADCVTILGKFHDTLREVYVISSGVGLIGIHTAAIRNTSVLCIVHFNYGSSVEVVSYGMRRNLVTQSNMQSVSWVCCDYL
jgi:hypothetical protein